VGSDPVAVVLRGREIFGIFETGRMEIEKEKKKKEKKRIKETTE